MSIQWTLKYVTAGLVISIGTSASAAIFLIGSCNIAYAADAAFNCSEPSAPVRADDSPNKAYFAKLLQRGTAAPLKDFIKLWYPDRKGAVDGEANSNQCKKEEAATTLYQKDSRCFADTVYSWGSQAKLNALQKSMPDNGSWESDPNPGHMLDTTISAVGSFAYGPIPVRLKLRPGTYGSSIERPIGNGDKVESWSFGTPENYDEIVRDYLRSRSSKPWLGYWVTSRDDSTDRLIFNGKLDGHYFTEKNLKLALLGMIKMILNGEGRIYYAAGTCRNRQLEFETRFPTYINPFIDREHAAQVAQSATESAAH